MPTSPAPGCCVDTPADGAPTPVVGARREVAVLLVEDSRADVRQALLRGATDHVLKVDDIAGALLARAAVTGGAGTG